ncbi:MAG: NAD-dependent epimerase/dehydratase family protein [Chthoniobacterales bacterium]
MTGDLVLVTGARGFVGWHVAKRLLSAQAKVRGLTRSLNSPLPEDDPGIEWVEGDITRPETLIEPLRDCRYLFHVAGDYRFWAPQPGEIYEANVSGTIGVLDAAWKAGIEKVVYTSTCGILAAKNRGEGNETQLVSTREVSGPYRRSKLLAYHEVQKRCKNGWPIVTVLPTSAIGPCDLRPTPTGRIIVEFLRGTFPMIAHTGLNFVDVRDVAAGHLLALDRGIAGERYLIGCQNLSLREFLTKLEPFAEHRVPKLVSPYFLSRIIAEVSERAAKRHNREPLAALEAVRVSRYTNFFSSSKAIFQIGYKPNGIDRAIEDAVAYFSSKKMV